MNREEIEYSNPPTREQIEKGFSRLCNNMERFKDLNIKNKARLTITWS